MNDSFHLSADFPYWYHYYAYANNISLTLSLKTLLYHTFLLTSLIYFSSLYSLLTLMLHFIFKFLTYTLYLRLIIFPLIFDTLLFYPFVVHTTATSPPLPHLVLFFLHRFTPSLFVPWLPHLPLHHPSLSSLSSFSPPFSHSPLTLSDFLRSPPHPRRIPFAPSLIYCITVHEVANLHRVILYKYVSQINIHATTICIRASRQLQDDDVLVIVTTARFSFLRIQHMRSYDRTNGVDKSVFDNEVRIRRCAC